MILFLDNPPDPITLFSLFESKNECAYERKVLIKKIFLILVFFSFKLFCLPFSMLRAVAHFHNLHVSSTPATFHPHPSSYVILFLVHVFNVHIYVARDAKGC
jgi:hypothetical protein